MILSDHITTDQTAKEILKDMLIKHNSGQCDCREQNGYPYPCKASEWLRGIISSKQVVEDYYYEKQK